MEIKTYVKNGEMFLPRRCWYSQNAGNKPLDMEDVLGVCLHKISGKIAFPEDPYNKERIVKEIFEKYRVSYNIWIDQEGIVELLVPWRKQAFHAGKSRWRGKNYCNKFLIGIGLISDGHEFSDKMMDSLAELLLYLMDEFRFTPAEVTTHQHIRRLWNSTYPSAQGDDRTGDPGRLPWDKLRDLMARPVGDLDGG